MLVLGTADKLFEGFIILVWVSAYLELFASQADMVGCLAGKAVTFFANVTCKIAAIYFRIKDKPIFAVSTWAPRNILLQP